SFHCLCAALYLHSFPTRRSSDLRVGVGPLSAHRQVLAMTLAAVGPHVEMALDTHRHFAAQIPFDFVSLIDDLADLDYIIIAEVIDRKSTRLNSSHVSISYAVFCL